MLSKSQFVRGKQCHKSLWLYRHRSDLREVPNESQQVVFDSGTKVGELAQQLFPGGILVSSGSRLIKPESKAEKEFLNGMYVKGRRDIPSPFLRSVRTGLARNFIKR
jgi:hypothetical protein